VTRWLWPAAAVGAGLLFLAIRYAAEAEPAFAPADLPLASLDAELLDGGPLPVDVPTVILLWMPG
jgi:hypothetical protein